MLLISQSSLSSFEGMNDKNYLHTWKGREQSNICGGFADAPPEGHLCRFFSAHRKKLGRGSRLLFPTPPLIKLETSPQQPSPDLLKTRKWLLGKEAQGCYRAETALGTGHWSFEDQVLFKQF